MATVTEMLSEARSWLNTVDPTSVAVSDAIMLQLLNNTQNSLSSAIWFPAQEESAFIDLVGNQVEYDMHELIEKPICFRYQTNDWLLKQATLTQIQAIQENETGQPTTYYLFGTKVGFYPTPAANETNAVKYWYFRSLKNLVTTVTDPDTETDVCEIPAKYHWVVALGAALMAARIIDKDNKGNQYLEMYREEVKSMSERFASRGEDELNEIGQQTVTQYINDANWNRWQ